MERAREGRAGHRASRRVALVLASALWMAPLAGACGGDAPVSAGAPVRPRIVSLVPAATRTLAALGAGDAVVGRATDDRTPGFDGVADVGRVLQPRLEAVLGTAPTAVVVWHAAADRVDRLHARGVVVVPVHAERLDDALDLPRTLGALAGRAERGEALRDSLAQALERVRARTELVRRPSVLWVVSADPLVVAGPRTLPDDLLEVAGGVNVFADAPTPWPRPSLESLIARRPDVIVWAEGPGVPAFESVRPHSPWSHLVEGADARVIPVDSDLVHEAGPRVAEAACLLSLLLHPLPSSGSSEPGATRPIDERK